MYEEKARLKHNEKKSQLNWHKAKVKHVLEYFATNIIVKVKNTVI